MMLMCLLLVGVFVLLQLLLIVIRAGVTQYRSRPKTRTTEARRSFLGKGQAADAAEAVSCPVNVVNDVGRKGVVEGLDMINGTGIECSAKVALVEDFSLLLQAYGKLGWGLICPCTATAAHAFWSALISAKNH